MVYHALTTAANVIMNELARRIVFFFKYKSWYKVI